MLVDILWYHNSKFIRSNDNVKIDINFEQCKTTCIILRVTKEHVGFYQCKAVNDVSESTTRAKFELASASNISETTTEEVPLESQPSQEAIETHTTGEISGTKTEKTKRKVKHIGKKGSNKLHKATTTDSVEVAIPEKTIIEIHTNEKDKEEFSSATFSSSNVNVHKETFLHQEADIEIREEIEEIHIKVYKEILSEVDTFNLGDEVDQILTSIEANKFGTGEMALRELATIACLLRKGMTIMDVIHLYHSDMFPSLKIPESQAAMVQLVERHGHESLITEIFSEAAEDEHLVASTVGFRAFMRMIEIHNESIEDIITKFRCEDFYSHEWHQSDSKEEIIETIEGVFMSTEQRFTSGKC